MVSKTCRLTWLTDILKRIPKTLKPKLVLSVERISEGE